MIRTHIVVALALAAAACGGGGGGDTDTGTDSAEEPDADVPVDTGTDTTTDTGADSGTDTGTDTTTDTLEEEPAGICGNFEVEPGEDCDPPEIEVPCTSPCGTTGTGECTLECTIPEPADCTPPAESCNLADDDCDGLVDEGAVEGFGDPVSLAAGDARAAVTWTGGAWAALWTSGDPADLSMSLVDRTGRTVLAPTTLAVTGASATRPGAAWTGSSILVAWAGDGERHVAAVGTDGTVTAQATVAATGIAPGTSLAWTGSRAALAWVELVAGDPEVLVAFVGPDGVQQGDAVRVTDAAGAAADPRVDVSAGEVAVVWTDERSGDAQAHLAVLDHDGVEVAADRALTTTGGVTGPSVDARRRIAAWSDDRDGTPRAWTLALDASWDPIGPEEEIAPAADALLVPDDARIDLVAGPTLFGLDPDGTAAGAGTSLALGAAGAAAWGDVTAALVGPDDPLAPTELLLALAGCSTFASCTSWMLTITPLETRTGWDGTNLVLAHEAASAGSWDARPVTYLSIQLWQDEPWRGPTSPGLFPLDDDPYDECGACILLYEDCGTSSCARVFLARAGDLDIEAIGVAGDRFAGTLARIQLQEVTIDSTTRISTPVPGGDEICLLDYAFDEIIGP